MPPPIRVLAILLGLGGWLFWAAAGAGEIDPGGPFQLTDHTGKQVTDKDYRGSHLLVFFGYTACPDVCPTTLLEVTRALALLGAKVGKVRALFITVDPARDTPATLARYLDLFEAPITGLTGRPDQIRSVAGAYKAFYQKSGIEGEDYTMDHGAFVYLMGPDGGFLDVFGYATPPEKMAKTISRFLARPGS